MSSKSTLDLVRYPEVAEVRDRILRFVCRTEDAMSIKAGAGIPHGATPKCLHLLGPSGNGKSHILRTLAAKYRHQTRTGDDDYKPVWLIHADELKAQIAHLGGDWSSVAGRYIGSRAFLFDDLECLRDDAAARACLAQIARGFAERGRPVVLTETSDAAPAEYASALEMPELARLRRMAESISIHPPGELGIKLLIRHFARLNGQRFPLPLVEALAVSVLRLDQPSVRACQQITTKLVAWCIFHRVGPGLEVLAAMRVATLQSVGLDPRLAV